MHDVELTVHDVDVVHARLAQWPLTPQYSCRPGAWARAIGTNRDTSVNVARRRGHDVLERPTPADLAPLSIEIGVRPTKNQVQNKIVPSLFASPWC